MILLANVLDEYLDTALTLLSKIYPNHSKKELKDILVPILNLKLKNPTIHLDNNVTGENHDTTFIELCNWMKNDKPVVAGNATFYMQPSIQQSPASNMLRTMKKQRKEIKNNMFACDPHSVEYQFLDLDQQNLKVVLNAEYGGSGNETAAFYSEYSPPATTLMAQSLITTAAAFFESYVGDNQVFFSNNECFDWINAVMNKQDPIPKWMKVPTIDEVVRRIAKHCDTAGINFVNSLKRLITNCNEQELCYLYYANNIRDFVLNHPHIQNIIREILSKLPTYEVAESKVPEEFKDKFKNSGKEVEEYNKWIAEELFMNPYHIPDKIKSEMDELITLFTKFIYTDYLTPDSIIKMNNHNRNTDILSDTDSVVVYVNTFVSLILNDVFPEVTFNRKKMYNEFILSNVITACFSEAIKKLLDYYGRCHNMDEESRKELAMKNELYFRVLFLMKVKKRYVASIALREGHIMNPFKIEIKGMDFIKSGVTELVSKRFTKILKDNILYADEINIHGLNTDLKKFEQEIIDDLKSGGTQYLSTTTFQDDENKYKEIETKEEGKRSSAWNQAGYVGSMNWNEINSDNKINGLDRVFIIKLISKEAKALEKIKDKYPDKYNIIIDKIFNSEIPFIKNRGLRYICIPFGMDKIPKWIRPLIDYDIIVSDTMASFNSVLEVLEMEQFPTKTPNGDAKRISCLVSL